MDLSIYDCRSCNRETGPLGVFLTECKTRSDSASRCTDIRAVRINWLVSHGASRQCHYDSLNCVPTTTTTTTAAAAAAAAARRRRRLLRGGLSMIIHLVPHPIPTARDIAYIDKTSPHAFCTALTIIMANEAAARQRWQLGWLFAASVVFARSVV